MQQKDSRVHISLTGRNAQDEIACLAASLATCMLHNRFLGTFEQQAIHIMLLFQELWKRERFLVHAAR